MFFEAYAFILGAGVGVLLFFALGLHYDVEIAVRSFLGRR